MISVILPARNGMPYLRDAILSILGQTHRDFELLLIDDGSTDETPGYCQSIRDTRLRYVRLEGVGLVEALNLGLREARAPVIARMDADDVSLPTRLEKQLDLMRQRTLVLLSCQFDRIDPGGKVTGHTWNLLTDEAIRWRLMFTPAFVHPGAMFDRRAALDVGGYQREFDVAQDFDLWTRLAACGRMGNHAETLLQYRSVPGSLSASRNERQIKNAAIIASRYAAASCPGVSEAEWYELHRLSSVGERPATYSTLHLSRTFSVARAYFRDRYGTSCSELNDSIGAFEQHLRWRCLTSPDRGWLGAYRAARRFDPEGSRLSAVLRRRMSGWVKGETAPSDSWPAGPDTNRIRADEECHVR
jgi:glycosyltransferase involved in cell wall biosynthesis